MHDVTAAWVRIERWLGRHAPAGLEVLAPPAGRDEIAPGTMTRREINSGRGTG
ncbi:hypothetical protein [Actinoplanes sp. NPDC049802]|uniref:hypothetical protein n=1 Tax=Actinoplanes sp. NPDC049802 TaxID=3154742 RepID=UPI0033FB785A